ncbi:MAG TPA: cupin domain-containing protein [Ktedonobacterales bacterium]
MLTAREVIELLGLEPLPVEGGRFRVTYRAEETAVLPGRGAAARPLSGAIYYLLHGDAFSALHRLRTDEVYHFYLGEPVEMLLLHPDGHGETLTLGQEIASGQRVQLVVPSGVWQGSRLALARHRDWALMGTTMAPAFDDADFELGDRAALIAQYPAFADLIRGLTP